MAQTWPKRFSVFSTIKIIIIFLAFFFYIESNAANSENNKIDFSGTYKLLQETINLLENQQKQQNSEIDEIKKSTRSIKILADKYDTKLDQKLEDEISKELKTIVEKLSKVLATQVPKDEKVVSQITTLRSDIDSLSKKLIKPDKNLDLFPDLIKGAIDLLKSALWPCVTLFIFFFVLRNRDLIDRLNPILRTFKSFKFLNVEVVFNESKKAEIENDANNVLKAYKEEVIRRYEAQVTEKHIRQKHEGIMKVLRAYLEPILQARQPSVAIDSLKLRSTVHVPDALLDDSLYQLLDYYPVGEGHGRSWSIRYGLIGRSWRLQESLIEGTVAIGRAELVNNWGMTYKQASAAAYGRRSFASIILRDVQQIPVGIFYLDADPHQSFGRDKQEEQNLIDIIIQECGNKGLIENLASINAEISKVTPTISLPKS